VPDVSYEWMAMHWLCRNKHLKTSLGQSRFASAAEIIQGFNAQSKQLQWIAEVITGNAILAAQCVVNARAIAESDSGVFRDWLVQWARTATVRNSLAPMHERILQAAELRYEDVGCAHGGHETLSIHEVTALQQRSPSVLASNLDDLARAVLILRGVQHAASQDCALTLGVSRVKISAAYCVAIDWLSRGREPKTFSTASAL
jgi:hypothetical protein